MFKVGAPSGGLFVGDEVAQRNETHRLSENRVMDPIPPCRIEGHTVDVCRNVNSDGRNADLVHDFFFSERFGRHSIML
jgi:hypothetical protein